MLIWHLRKTPFFPALPPFTSIPFIALVTLTVFPVVKVRHWDGFRFS